MGARVYIPGLGRFLSVDPQQGGTPNNYVYPVDPVNDFDLDGNFGWKSLANIASIASMIPGPIGMVASGVAAVSYAAAGDHASAALAVASIALAAVPGAVAAVKVAQAVKTAKTIATAARAGEDISKLAPVGRVTSNLAGRMFVGTGAKKVGARLMSSNGLRGYRAPAPKSSGLYQSNFEHFVQRPVSGKSYKYPNRSADLHLNAKRRGR